MNRFLRGLVVLGLLITAGAAFSGRLNELFPFDLASAAASPQLMATTDQEVNAAIQQVIQRSNDEQVQAIAAHDSSLMADAVTSEHYQELVKINQNLLDNGVTSISLVRLEWDAVAVNGSSAPASPYTTRPTVSSAAATAQS